MSKSMPYETTCNIQPTLTSFDVHESIQGQSPGSSTSRPQSAIGFVHYEPKYDLHALGGSDPVLDSDADSDSRLDDSLEASSLIAEAPAYEPLPEGAFRLLVLLPGEGGDEVLCELVTFNIESAPEYEAISYAWGSSFDYINILVNGKPHRIGHNLIDCLRNLRHEEYSRVIWVDALCINQVDVEEKSAQVALMPQIYRSARKTLVWLGTDASYRFYMHFEFADDGERKKLMATRVKASESFRLIERLAQDEHLQYDYESVHMALVLRYISNLSWFGRAWVVQETLLSRSAYVVIGKAVNPWNMLFQAASNFVIHATTCCRADKANESAKRYAECLDEDLTKFAQVILSFQRIPLGTKNELLANLWMFRNRLATVNYDKVYSILGMLKCTDINIEPDYGTPFAHLCLSVILEDIRVSGNLHALKGIRSKATSIASWGTDWSSLDYWAEDQSRVLTELYKKIYSASGTYTARVTRNVSPFNLDALGIAGRIFDSVEYISELLPFRSELVCAQKAEELGALLAMLKKLKRPDLTYIAGGSAFSAFWRTLVSDAILPYRESQNLFHNMQSSSDETFKPSIRRATAIDCVAFLTWWLGGGQGHYLHQTMEGHKIDGSSHNVPMSSLDMSSELVQYCSRTVDHLRKLPAVRDINASVARATSGRRLFVTLRGYIGLGPELTQYGDEVAILLGGSTPFILRDISESHNPRYTLLGDCYVHGCMDGELVKDERTDDWETLVLT